MGQGMILLLLVAVVAHTWYEDGPLWAAAIGVLGVLLILLSGIITLIAVCVCFVLLPFILTEGRAGGISN